MFAKYKYETLIEWLEDFCLQLDCPEPDINFYKARCVTEYYKNLGAWETQQIILKRLRHAIDAQKRVTENE